MATHKFFTVVLLLLAGFGTALTASAQSDVPEVTMDQAVLKVQQQTGGKVLSAEPHHVGRRVEYRIKVLTPQGHVRVMAIQSEVNRGSMSTPVFSPPFKNPPVKNPPVKNPGSKEKH
jgi:hypothetical protein